MTDQEGGNIESPIEERAASSGEGSAPPKDSVTLFIESVSDYFSVEELQGQIRITPQGLFVRCNLLGRTVSAYQEMLQKRTQGAVAKSSRKCLKRLFGSEEPAQYYLVEGKECLVGHLIPYEVQQPQRYKIPFYLGSLLDTHEYLHPRDPFLNSLPNVDVEPGPRGVIITLQIAGRQVSVEPEVVKEFAALTEHSRKRGQGGDQGHHSVRDTVQYFVKSAKKARPVRGSQCFLVPAAFARKRKIEFLRLGYLYFVIEGRSKIVGCFELRGRNLNRLVRNEVQLLAVSMRNNRIEGFELPRKKQRFLGSVRVRGERYFVRSHAVQQFVEAAMQVHSFRESLDGPSALAEFLKKFSSLFQNSEQIAAGRVAKTVRETERRAVAFRIVEGWVFVIGSDRVLLSCRYPPLERRQHDHNSRGKPKGGHPPQESSKGGNPRRSGRRLR